MAYLVDIELLVKKALDQHLTGVTVLPESDVDAIDELPLVIVRAGNGSGTQNGPLHLGQVWDVSLTILDHARDGLSALAAGKATVSDVTEVLADRAPRSRYPGVGVFVALLEADLFTRRAQASLGPKDIVQFDGSFTYTVQPA